MCPESEETLWIGSSTIVEEELFSLGRPLVFNSSATHTVQFGKSIQCSKTGMFL